MIKEVIKLEKLIERHKYCDVCEAEIAMGLACGKAKCEYCKKDLCNKCIGYEESVSGDYRIVYCNKCWNIGKDYRSIIKHHDDEMYRLYNEWKDKCK